MMKHLLSFMLGQSVYPCVVKPYPKEFPCMKENFPIEWELFENAGKLLAISTYALDWEMLDIEAEGKLVSKSFGYSYLLKMKNKFFTPEEITLVLGDLFFPSQKLVQNMPEDYQQGKMKIWDYDENGPFISVCDCPYWLDTKKQFPDEDGIPSVYVYDTRIVRPSSPEADEIGYRLCFAASEEILQRRKEYQ